MFKPQRDSGHGGWKGGNKSFGDRKPWERDSGGRNFDRPAMHPAVCAECHNPCEVPFRPVEGRPVFCSNCFKKDDKRGPRFEEKRISPAQSTNTSQLADQLKSLNAKLDAILKILTPMVAPVAVKTEAVKKVEAVKEEIKALKKVKKEKAAKKTKK